MKKIWSISVLSLVLMAGACNNPSDASTSGSADSGKVIPPPADNSSATNPSVADTAFSKKDSASSNSDPAK